MTLTRPPAVETAAGPIRILGYPFHGDGSISPPIKRIQDRLDHLHIDPCVPRPADNLCRQGDTPGGGSLCHHSHTTLVASPPIGRLARSAEAERVAPSRWPSTQRQWGP